MDKTSLVFGLIIISILAAIFGREFFAKPQSTSPVNLSGQKIQVTTSFYPLYFFASQIGGEKAQVQNLTPAGAEPHDWEPTTRDITRIEKSHLLILNGGVETWGDKIKSSLQNKNITIIVAGEGLFTRQLSEEEQTSPDTHVWLSPPLARKEADAITKGFIKIDPSNIVYYEANQKRLDDQLDQLDQAYKQGLNNCQQKDIITSHAAFGYLAATYGLNQVSVAGLSPDAEPSSQQLAKIITFAKSRNVKYIFFEKLVSPKLAETIAREINAQTLVLDPLEGLSNDEINSGKNYFTLMQENLKNLQKALECKTT